MLVIGADHAGFALKEFLKKKLARAYETIVDVGARTKHPGDDYPVFALELAKRVRRTAGSRGILICGSGVGMALVANKVAGIRAANVWHPRLAVRARQEEDANVLVLPADFVSRSQAELILQTWLKTPFKRIARYRRRLGEVQHIEHHAP
ncbi:MAG: RpiB/LacA/LacB family sugar-phosphate isomerase [Patescibacteria group bacterium]